MLTISYLQLKDFEWERWWEFFSSGIPTWWILWSWVTRNTWPRSGSCFETSQKCTSLQEVFLAGKGQVHRENRIYRNLGRAHQIENDVFDEQVYNLRLSTVAQSGWVANAEHKSLPTLHSSLLKGGFRLDFLTIFCHLVSITKVMWYILLSWNVVSVFISQQ